MERAALNCLAATLTGCLALSPMAASAEDFRLHFPPILAMSPHGVNLQTSRYELSQKEFSIGPLSVDLRWTSIGAGVLAFPFAFPTASSGEYNISIEHPANGIARSLRGSLVYSSVNTSGGGSMTVVYVQIGDRKLQFTVQPSNIFWPWNLEAQGWSLQKTGSIYSVTNKSGDVYTFADHPAIPAHPQFDKSKVLSNVVFADAHRLDYSYGSAAELRSVIDSRGYAVVLEYVPATQVITACGYNTAVQYVGPSTLCSAAPIKTSYSFSSASGSLRLVSMTNASGNVATVAYSGEYISCITFPASSTCRIQNFYGPMAGESSPLTGADQVYKQITASGDIWRYSATNPPGLDMPPLEPGEVRRTYGRMTDPLGNLTVAAFDNGVAASVASPAGTVTYTFNGLCPLTITYPEGNQLQVGSSNSCNVSSTSAVPKPGSPLAAANASLTYPTENLFSQPTICNAASPKLCDKPTAKIDERGNQTDYTYDLAHGGMLTETGPAVNGIRPQTRFTYVQRNAWVKNSGGAFVQSSTPVWLIASKSSCKAGAASGAGCAIGGDEVVTSYDYGPNSGPNNLLLRGTVDDANGLARRTCFGYDKFGNKVSETKPRAGLTSCP